MDDKITKGKERSSDRRTLVLKNSGNVKVIEHGSLNAEDGVSSLKEEKRTADSRQAREGNYGIVLANMKEKSSDANLVDAEREIAVEDTLWRRKKALRVATYTVLWYTLATALSVYNKFLLGKAHYGFPFPMFMAMTHMISHFFLSFAVMQWLMPRLKPTCFPSLRNYLLKVFPCGLATGMDISFSNSSLQYISLGFYTMVKSSAPVLVLAFAFLFRLEKPTFKLIGVISIISLGTLLMVIKQPGFNATGFLQVSFATLCSGLRWSITQILLQREEMGMSNPVATMFFLTPLMAGSLAIATLLMEGLPALVASPFFSAGHAPQTVSMLLAGGLLAFLMTMAEFKLISVSSVVTFSVLGIAKEILTICVSHVIFEDRFAPINIVGLVVSISGIGLYHVVRIEQLQKKKKVQREQRSQEFFFSNDSLQHAASDSLASLPSPESDRISQPASETLVNNELEGDLSQAYERLPLDDGVADFDQERYDGTSLVGLRNSVAITTSSFGYAPIYVPPQYSTPPTR